MDLSFSPEYETFRSEVRAFLEESWGARRQKHATAAELGEFRRLATGRGYLYRNYPRQYGGSEQPPDVLKGLILAEEFTACGAPMEITGVGVYMVAPVLLEVGSPWQKEHFIPKTLTGEYRWAQGYSEPGSGSDLASLRSRAELVNGEWVINGHKIWTTRANEANFMFALLRTEPNAGKHAGLSYILLDLKQPGVTIRPIHQINDGREFCEVFLENVRTPADWIVGERGNGWAVSKVNLKHERNAIGSTTRTQPVFDSLVRTARKALCRGRPAIEDPAIRARLVAVETQIQAQRWAGYYQMTVASRGGTPGVISLLNKLTTTNITQELAGIAADVIDTDGLRALDDRRPGNQRWLNQMLGSLALSLAGGTSNIQRNIIAERGLGLPRDDSRDAEQSGSDTAGEA
jgi:alkylation response protein AidB-like acyl-CoA dehydrogenase